jgi:predicted AAA+ superfamily ATPase
LSFIKDKISIFAPNFYYKRQNSDYECNDFVCKKPQGQRIYVQASYIIADEATREREFGNLRAIKDNYPKYVISMTPLVGRQDSDGITHLHLRRFLSEGLE